MAFAVLILYVCSYFLHLTARVPGLGAMRLDLILGCGTFVLILFQRGKDRFRGSEPTGRALTRFVVYIFLSLPCVTWPGSVLKQNLSEWFTVALFYFLVVGAVRSELQLRLLMTVFLSCQMFRILEPLYLHVSSGYWGSTAYSHTGGAMTALSRLSGAPSDIINPNQLAWVTVTAITFLFYLTWQRGKWGKLLFAALLVPACDTLLLTGSRSGILSLGAAICGMILLSKQKKRNLLFTLVLVVPLALLVMSRLAPDLQTRYVSMVDSSVTGGDTAQGRISTLFTQIGSIRNNPLFGNGLGTSQETNWNVLGGSSQITHDLYIEILQETGIIGMVLFLIYVAAIVKVLRQARTTLLRTGYDEKDSLVALVSALQAWVFMDLFYSLSCFGLRSWEWYFFGGVALVCSVLAQGRQQGAVAQERGSRPWLASA